MTTALAAAPLLVAILLLVLGRGTLAAALAGLATAVVVGVLRFPVAGRDLLVGGLEFLPLLVEVTLILLTGVVLAQLLVATGAIRRISDWVLDAAPGPVAGAVLVVFGIVPFAEAVTGYGIGVTVGVPILVHLGFRPVRAALLGVAGMFASPWGGLAPGMRVASGMLGLPLTELGVATTLPHVVNAVAVAALVILVTRGAGQALVFAPLSAIVLSAGIWVANVLVGTPLAGALGALTVIAVLLLLFRLRGGRATVDGSLGSAVLPYAVLTVGLLVAELAHSVLDHPVTGLLTSPPVWLAVACVVAGVQLATRGPGPGPAVRTGLRAFASVGTVTALFMVLGWTLSVTGMSTVLGEGLAGLGLWVAPVLTAVGSVLTGSLTGSAAMFSSTVGALAESGGIGVLPLAAVSMASGALGTLASPPRVALALTLAHSTAEDHDDGARDAGPDAPGAAEQGAQERTVLVQLLAVVAVGTAMLAATTGWTT